MGCEGSEFGGGYISPLKIIRHEYGRNQKAYLMPRDKFDTS